MKSLNIDNELKQFSDWRNAGLGRMTIEQVFEFSLLMDDAEIGIKAFSIGYRWSEKIKGGISFVGLEIAIKAAKKHSLPEVKKLEELLLIERKRIDNSYKSKNWFGSLFKRFLSRF